MKYTITLLAAASLIIATPAPAPARPFNAVPANDSDLNEIRLNAAYIGKQSYPSCLSAVCVKGECKTADLAYAALINAKAVITPINSYLLRLREKETDMALAALENARYSRERVNTLKRLQLLQDALQLVAEAAAEAASWQDFLVNYSEKVVHSEKTFEWFLAAMESHISRLRKLLKLKDQGKEKQEKQLDSMLNIFTAEASILVVKIRSAYRKHGFNHTKTRVSIGKLIKKIGDLVVNVDRERRRYDIQMHMRNAAAEHQATLSALAEAHRINERMGAVTQAKKEIQRALLGARSCAQKICQRPPAEAKPKFDPPPLEMRPLPALDLINTHIQEIIKPLQSASRNYQIIGDHQSRITLDKHTIGTRSPIQGKYALSNICIPPDVRFVVFKAPQTEQSKPLGDYGTPQGKIGKLKFWLFQGLEGEWRDKRNRRFNITTNENEIKLFRPNTPVRGQTRTYTGSLDITSKPGDYVLALHSQEKGDTFLPTRFKIKGKKTDPTIELLSTPQSIEDISPRIPGDIRNQLLKAILTERIGYRLILKPKQTEEGEITLDTELWTYRFKWGKRDRKIKSGSLKEKRAAEITLRRVEKKHN